MKTTYVTILALALAGGAGCKKDRAEKAPPAAEKTGEAAPAPAPADPEAEKKREEAERAKEGLAKLEADMAAEKARWTPELEKQAAALVAKKFPDARAALTAIVASPHRMPAHPSRDPYRHPVETLTFFGIEPSMTVIELGAGQGWYTEILAPLLAREGKLVAVGFDPAGPADSMRTVYGKRLEQLLALSPALFGKVERVAVDPPA